MSPTREQIISPRPSVAGGPLPFLPRRTSSQTRSRVSPTPTSQVYAKPPLVVTVEKPSPERALHLPNTVDDTVSGSSSASESGIIHLRVRRRRRSHSPVVSSSEHSTPTPARRYDRSGNLFPGQSHTRSVSESAASQLEDTSDLATPRPALPRSMVYIPGVSLRLTTESLKSRQHPYPKSDSSAPSSAEMTRAKEWPNLVRKKSGQILKSSLKASSSATRASLTVGTFTGTSKSEPTTPTHKAVHFDSHLEHVKLFLAEQKPLAVSRDGSPTDDTSGTDSDFPSFMYGDLSDDSGRKKSLSLNVVNMPSSVDLNANVALEDLALSPHDLNIIGRIRLRNLAYSKAVAVRFTFDSWQTTSEVAGRYEKTIDSEFDRFVFTIRLTDLLSRVEDKILHLAIRYSVGGKEYWDNNGGNNYVAKFAKGKTSPEKASDAPGSALAKLHSKLERVVQGTEGFPSKLSPTTQTSEPLPSHATLTSRYTWGKAYKSPWTPPEISSPPRRLRHQSYPVTTKPKSNYAAPAATSTITPAVPKIRPLGSPREIDGSDTTSKSIVTDELLLSPLHSPVDKSSRHHRRGYFDLDHMETSDLKRTPSGTPPTGSIGDLASFNASFKENMDVKPMLLDTGGAEDLSTPSTASGSSTDSSRSSSPSSLETATQEQVTSSISSSNVLDYHHLINKFCFYTGPQASPTRIPRAHSANDVGEIFASMSPEVPGFSRRGFHTPVRSLAAVALAVTEGVDFGGDVSPGTTPVAAKTRTELSFS